VRDLIKRATLGAARAGAELRQVDRCRVLVKRLGGDLGDKRSRVAGRERRGCMGSDGRTC
jgi:hypothetical protein